MEFTIGELQAGDWEQVCQIYLEGLATGQASFEVVAPSWEAWDQRFHSHSRLVVRVVSEKSAGPVIAWAALAPISVRRCYAGVAEASLYVASEHRGRGIGKRLL